MELVQVMVVYVVMVAAIVAARRWLSGRRWASRLVTVALYSVGAGLVATVVPGVDAPTQRVGVFVMTGLAMMALWPVVVGRLEAERSCPCAEVAAAVARSER